MFINRLAREDGWALSRVPIGLLEGAGVHQGWCIHVSQFYSLLYRGAYTYHNCILCCTGPRLHIQAPIPHFLSIGVTKKVSKRTKCTFDVFYL
jgi:hypothetical protein